MNGESFPDRLALAGGLLVVALVLVYDTVWIAQLLATVLLGGIIMRHFILGDSQ